MSRFGNLEFGEVPEQSRAPVTSARNDDFFLEEARVAFESGYFERALRSYARALEYNAKKPAAWVGQARMLLELGEYTEANLWADKALEMFPNEPELLACKAVALGRGGDLGAALMFSDMAVTEGGSSAFIWLARGDVLLARGEKRAEYCFDKAFAQAPGDWMVYWLGSRIQLFYKHFARALKWAQEAVALNAGAAAAWLEMGRCQLALGLTRQGRATLEQARELDPGLAALGVAVAEAGSVGWIEWLSRRWRSFFDR